MYVFLLVLGALTTAAGLSLVASAVAQEGVTAVTPGMIASVGGLVLIGLGLLVRELQRIERALAARPMPRATRPAEAPVAIPPLAPERPTPSPQARIPFPPRPKPGAIGPASTPADDGALPRQRERERERERERFPRLEPAPATEEPEAALLPRALIRTDDDMGEVRNVAAGGASPAARMAARLNVAPRPAAVPSPRERPRGSVFDAFWPKGQRGRRDGPGVPGQQPAPGEPAPSEPLPDMHPPAAAEAAAPVTVLKSGTVEGMAYTLYSDGSIEAQLPQGMVRFGSITELRNHIESES
jgi:hypothetical protein